VRNVDPLTWRSQDVFIMSTERLRILRNYGLPTLIYLLVDQKNAVRLGHA
jgi:hypothetical protein